MNGKGTVTGRHCWLCHTPGSPAWRRFPTRKSSGREPIWLIFRVTAGSKRPFAPSPGKTWEEAATEGGKTWEEAATEGARTAKEEVEVLEQMARKAEEASAANIALKEWGEHRNPAAHKTQ
ncbi:hypothetical protein NDU88_002964 [Pleurodeles waltl]|uniref:Uncharacterized protein n=1 Tax=Pleurodeles waltl TaxID=8319 RepID=A0AAV7UX46_PLEWA|nr:hypothetical protein NDU88_002964 [Pleurodeles waltl]